MDPRLVTLFEPKDGAGGEGGLSAELREGLSRYWSLAAGVLEGSGVRLFDPPPGYDALENNFFSGLFLYSYRRAGIASPRRRLYAAVNQCLRGVVTGCDNLLDDEYKPTLMTDLNAGGTRFRSILDMLASDRVLFSLLLGAMDRGELTAREAATVSAVSLRTLLRSGAQEASEEAGVGERLAPERVLAEIHHAKTGLLFQAPWAVPLALEPLPEERATPLLQALYDIGMGCQIMDDMVDMASDLEKSRHNYLLSLVFHGADTGGWERLSATGTEAVAGRDLLTAFPEAGRLAAERAGDLLRRGLGNLLSPAHRDRIPAVVRFLAGRLGTGRWMDPEAGT